jgi:hypothetical protein
MMSPKTPLKYFLKSDLKISKILKNRLVGRYVGFFFFSLAPLGLDLQHLLYDR